MIGNATNEEILATGLAAGPGLTNGRASTPADNPALRHRSR